MRKLIERNSKYVLILPAVLLLLVFSLYPFLRLFQFGFSSFTLSDIGAPPAFNGLKNIQTLLSDETFADSLRVTMIFVFGAVTLEFLLGFAIALAVDRGIRRADVFRTVFIIPMMVPPITIGLIWRLMYNPEFGVINILLRKLGWVEPPLWLADPHIALASVMVVDVWHWTPFVFLLILAGLQSLPDQLYEAGSLDGASTWQLFRYVTLPLMRYTVFVTLMFRTVLAFKAFDELFILTSGGPGNATEIIGLYIYKNAFTFGKLGYASHLAIVAILVMSGISLLFRAIIGRVNR